jgi:hypothetical protein
MQLANGPNVMAGYCLAFVSELLWSSMCLLMKLQEMQSCLFWGQLYSF